jgi:hypothetical protein
MLFLRLPAYSTLGCHGGKQASRQAGKQASKQASKQELLVGDALHEAAMPVTVASGPCSATLMAER